MVPTIESGVRDRMENPEIGSDVTLLVKVGAEEESHLEALDASASGIEVETELGLNYFRVKSPETELERICTSDSVEKVELEKTGEVMSSDFHIRTGQTR